MSTVVFHSVKVPEKHLRREEIYKYHADEDIKSRILEDFKKHSKNSLDHLHLDVNIEIVVKEYDTKNT